MGRDLRYGGHVRPNECRHNVIKHIFNISMNIKIQLTKGCPEKLVDAARREEIYFSWRPFFWLSERRAWVINLIQKLV